MDIFLSQIVFLVSELTNQGLTVVAYGLCGVFIVLLLFFVMIVVMQKVVEMSEKRSAKKKAKIV
jgi:Na+-transporting methylmalonyl-CoA/oxaloacetate decarboxylase gamma subunit